LQSVSVARSKEISELKKTDAEKQKVWSEDLPRNTRTVKLHRPSEDGDDEEPQEQSMTDIAAGTLANMEQ